MNNEQHSNFPGSGLFARLKHYEYIVVYLGILILAVLLIVATFYGESTPFYQSLIQPSISPWIGRIGWIIATISSYVSFLFIQQDIRVYPIPRDFIVTVFFLLNGALFLAWGVAFYYGESHMMAIWLAIVLFIYNYWIFIYVWNISRVGALFLIPNLVLYAYLLYGSIHLASINNAIH